MRSDAATFSWEFLHDVMRWSWAAAVIVGVGGTVLTRSSYFVAGFAVAAAVDVLTLDLAIRRGREALGEHAMSAFSPGLIALRLGVKAVLLVVAAAFLMQTAAFWGVVAGVLVVDTTVLVVGTVSAASRIFRGAGPTGDARRGRRDH